MLSILSAHLDIEAGAGSLGHIQRHPGKQSELLMHQSLGNIFGNSEVIEPQAAEQWEMRTDSFSHFLLCGHIQGKCEPALP